MTKPVFFMVEYSSMLLILNGYDVSDSGDEWAWLEIMIICHDEGSWIVRGFSFVSMAESLSKTEWCAQFNLKISAIIAQSFTFLVQMDLIQTKHIKSRNESKEYYILHHPALTCNRGRCQCLPHPWELGLLELWINNLENYDTLRFLLQSHLRKRLCLSLLQ